MCVMKCKYRYPQGQEVKVNQTPIGHSQRLNRKDNYVTSKLNFNYIYEKEIKIKNLNFWRNGSVI